MVYECADCGRQVSVIAGTILEQSKKPLALWFRAIFEVTASKQGISAAELQARARQLSDGVVLTHEDPQPFTVTHGDDGQ